MITKSFFALIFLTAFLFLGEQDWKDGTYKGISRSVYTGEPYFANTCLKIENGKITSISFFVRDSARHEDFNEKYEKYFYGNEIYVQQCRNDWKGVESYPDSLLKYQDLSKVDVISGATWSYNLFKAATVEALKQAEAGN